MSLVVEDGTGRSDAESYASAAEADTYLANRGIAAWAGGVLADKEAALRKAAAYMHNFYWKGYRISALQALDWPRQSVQVDNFFIPTSAVPSEVKAACIELAYRASTAELQSDQGQQVTSKTVGPISVTYAPGSTASKSYPAVAALLSRLLTGGNTNSIALVRG